MLYPYPSIDHMKKGSRNKSLIPKKRNSVVKKATSRKEARMETELSIGGFLCGQAVQSLYHFISGDGKGNIKFIQLQLTC